MNILEKLSKEFEIDHIGVAVESIEKAMPFYSALGFVNAKTEVVVKDKVKVAFIEFANSANIELLEATDETSPVAKFIAKRGPGMHHMCIRVKNIHQVIEELKKQNVQMIDQEARDGAHNCLVAFIHPKATGGLLLELSEPKGAH